MRRVAALLGALATVVAARSVDAADDRLSTDWHRAATLGDRDRLRQLRTAWVEGIRLAYAKGDGPAVRAEGALLDPDAALDDPIPPAGAYRCRVFKLGGVPGFSVSSAVDCRVSAAAGSVFAFAMLGAGQRTAGRIFPDTDIRGVFLGAVAMPEEARVMPYGRDGSRDVAGVVKRVGPSQWRIGVPYPRFESTIDVIELVPSS